MANVLRVRTVWTGFPGAPGYTNMFFDAASGDNAAATAAADVVTLFWQSLTTQFPSDVRWQVQSEVPLVDVASGQMVDQLTADTQPAVAGNGATQYSAPTGGIVDWVTSVFSNGRKIVGRTYLVPLGGNMYDGVGSLIPGALDAINQAAAALASTTPTSMMVYSRPTAGRPIGQANAVTSVRVPDRACVLRSRRD